MPANVPGSEFKLPLLLDATGQNLHVGIPSAEGWTTLFSSKLPAMESLFLGMQTCLEDTGKKISEVDALVFCEGPGSTLGLRIAAAAAKTILRENKPAPALLLYNAMDLAALLVEKPRTVLAPFRNKKKLLRHPPQDETALGRIEVIEEKVAEKLTPNPIHLAGPRIRDTLPDGIEIMDYDISRLTSGLLDLAPILKPSEHLELFDPEPAKFAEWQPSIQRPQQ
tara:strand:+ start:45 stop:716 length:672 start_codon:yes stop_codon:yes gene_type:complete